MMGMSLIFVAGIVVLVILIIAVVMNSR
jgi:hypothetical protein